MLQRSLIVFVAALVVLAVAQPAAQARGVSVRKLTAAELATARRVLQTRKGLRVLAKHTFRVKLPGRGQVVFASVEDTRGRGSMSFVLLRAGRVVERLAPYCGKRMAFFKLVAVAFRDVNGDKAPDLVAIGRVMTGVGPTGARDFPSASIYLSHGGKLVPSPALDQAFCDGMKLRTVRQVVRAARRTLRKSRRR